MDNFEAHIDFINQALGSGGLWKSKTYNNSNLSKLLSSIALIHGKIKNYQDEYFQELDIYKTTEKNIENWEKYVGIPDSVFVQTISLGLGDRIKQVVIKLIGFKNITMPRLQYILANIFNITQIKITRGDSMSVFPIIFGVFRFSTLESSTQDLYIELPKSFKQDGFPYTFPFVFAESKSKIIENFIKMIVPFEYNVYFNYTL